MKRVVKFSVLIAVMSIAMIGCFGNKNKSEGDKRLSVKSAYIIFENVEKGVVEERTHIMWDDYGKLYRSGKEENYTVLNEHIGKMFLVERGKYVELDKSFYSVGIMGIKSSGYFENKSAPDYTKLPNRTIAGKDCSVWSFTTEGITTTIGGWNGIIFLREDKGFIESVGVKIDMTLTAISFSEKVPPNSFDAPK